MNAKQKREILETNGWHYENNLQFATTKHRWYHNSVMIAANASFAQATAAAYDHFLEAQKQSPAAPAPVAEAPNAYAVSEAQAAEAHAELEASGELAELAPTIPTPLAELDALRQQVESLQADYNELVKASLISQSEFEKLFVRKDADNDALRQQVETLRQDVKLRENGSISLLRDIQDLANQPNKEKALAEIVAYAGRMMGVFVQTPAPSPAPEAEAVCPDCGKSSAMWAYTAPYCYSCYSKRL